MATNRLEILKQMVNQDPNNQFARYGLAMEYVNTGDVTLGINEFNVLLTQNPGYSAAYYHGGQAFEKLGKVDEARDLYRRGIDATTKNGDAHTRSELEAALSLLPI